MQTDSFLYFGYGSLVNCDTRHPDSVAVPGRLAGWVREWRIAGKTPYGGACSLTVRPSEGHEIAGLMVREHRDGLPALDKREWRYDRLDLVHGAFRPDADAALEAPGFVYRAKAEHYRWGDDDHPILQSYVDCVLAGFLKHWGEAGVRHFVEATEGWHVPIRRDRDAPLYPRAVLVPEQARVFFDDVLREADARWI